MAQLTSLHRFPVKSCRGESLDYANHVVSLSGHQEEPDVDQVTRNVIAHDDPGVANWLDTTGLERGFVTFRWTYTVPPTEMPRVSATKVPYAEIRQHLPAGTRTVAADERYEQIRVRQRHVQRRYRQY